MKYNQDRGISPVAGVLVILLASLGVLLVLGFIYIRIGVGVFDESIVEYTAVAALAYLAFTIFSSAYDKHQVNTLDVEDYIEITSVPGPTPHFKVELDEHVKLNSPLVVAPEDEEPRNWVQEGQLSEDNDEVRVYREVPESNKDVGYIYPNLQTGIFNAEYETGVEKIVVYSPNFEPLLTVDISEDTHNSSGE